jgi:hypothetical protein
MPVSISGFTFIRNGVGLGFPFEASIRSLLPLVDEFVVAVGKGEDDTLERVKAINDPKIRIIETLWNERMADRGFVYAQQKMIAQYSCTGDWAFYLEGDEVVHEGELAAIRASVERHHNNPAVEALVFDYLHFYGSPDWISISPGWYRRECRLIRNTIRSYAPDGQYWLVTTQHKRGATRRPRWPTRTSTTTAGYAVTRKCRRSWTRSASTGAKPRPRRSPTASSTAAPSPPSPARTRRPCRQWLATEAEPVLNIDPAYKPTPKENKYHFMRQVETLTGLDFSRKHFKLVA